MIKSNCNGNFITKSHSQILTNCHSKNIYIQQQQCFREQLPRYDTENVQLSISAELLTKKQTSIKQKQYRSHRKMNLYTRQNIQFVNRKNRTLRSFKMNLSANNPQKTMKLQGLQISGSKPSSEEARENKIKIKPFTVKSIQTIKNLKSTSLSLKKEESKDLMNLKRKYTMKTQPHLQERVLREVQTKKLVNRFPTTYEPQKLKVPNKMSKLLKISQGCHIPLNFESHLKKRCMQDNLNVMASFVKKSIKNLDKKDLITYLQKLIIKNNTGKKC